MTKVLRSMPRTCLPYMALNYECRRPGIAGPRLDRCLPCAAATHFAGRTIRKRCWAVMLTHDAVEREVNAAIRRIEALPTVLAPVIRIRQEELL